MGRGAGDRVPFGAYRDAASAGAGAANVPRQGRGTLSAAVRAADRTRKGWRNTGQISGILGAAYGPAIAATLERHGDLGHDLATAGPVAVTESCGHLRSDSAYHCV